MDFRSKLQLILAIAILLIDSKINHGFVNAIFFGEKANPGDVPWQLYFRIGSKFICGASLVLVDDGKGNAISVALTTAACVVPEPSPSKKTFKPSELTVTATHQFEDSDLNYLGQHRGVSKIVIHEKWDPETLENDIAILFLERDFDYKREVYAIHLPSKDLVIPGKGTVSGFGARGNSAELGNQLMKKDIKIATTTESWCLQKPDSVKGFMEDRFCINGATSDGVGTCKADRGGPIRFYIPGLGARIIGIISHQRQHSCDKDEPTVAIKITHYLDWIRAEKDAYLKEFGK